MLEGEEDRGDGEKRGRRRKEKEERGQSKKVP